MVSEPDAFDSDLQAAIVHGIESETVQDLLLDVTPLSLDIETAGGIITSLYHDQDPAPDVHDLLADNRLGVVSQVFEGDGSMTSKDNVSQLECRVFFLNQKSRTSNRQWWKLL